MIKKFFKFNIFVFQYYYIFYLRINKILFSKIYIFFFYLKNIKKYFFFSVIPWIKIIIFFIFFWITSGFYIIHPFDKGYILRFGKLCYIVSNGIHWKFNGIDQLFIIKSNQIFNFNKNFLFFTLDQYFCKFFFVMQYKVFNWKRIMFEINNPEFLLNNIVEKVLRNTVSTVNLNFILKNKDQTISKIIEKKINNALFNNKFGIIIFNVDFNNVKTYTTKVYY